MDAMERANAVIAQAGVDMIHGDRMIQVSKDALMLAIAKAISEARADVVAGSVYRHYKGNLYHGLAVADYTGERRLHKDGLASGFPEGEKLVVYLGLYDNPHGNRVCTRPLSEWGEPVETTPEQRLLLGGDSHAPYRPRYTKIA